MLCENTRNMKRCRCCLTEKCCKDINTEYYRSGRIEIYSKMLYETFDVQINYEEGKIMICEECIAKLREAAAFKAQVLKVEETFLETWAKLKKLGLGPPIDNLKSECDENKPKVINNTYLCDNIEFYHKTNNCFMNNDNTDWQDEVPSRDQENMCEIKSNPINTLNNVKSKNNHSDKNIAKSKRDKSNKRKCNKKDSRIKAVKAKKIPKVSRVTSPITTQSTHQTKQSEAKYQRENTIKLLLNSNICLFTSYKTKFGCYLCKERFLDIKHLREHTNMHSNDKYIVTSVNHLRGLTYRNVDISNLTCKICEQACQDLTELQTHLTVSHRVEFAGTKHFLSPYKLENGLQCIICRQKFNTFLRLSIHMNSHSTNNVCEICGVSYINRLSLRLHVQSVHKEKKCNLCLSTFPTNSTKVRHMRRVHGMGDYKRYCLLCEKTFRYTYLLMQHKIKEHGAKTTFSVCDECGKKFPSEHNLKVHIRAVHKKERNFPCSVCDMRFFTKCDQKRHERTHEDVRSFLCTHCEARYKTKDSWRRHLKRQHAQLLGQT